MARIVTDRRGVDATRAPEVHARLLAEREILLSSQIRAARDLATFDDGASFLFEGCASIAHYGVKVGYDGGQAQELCWLGKALRAMPELETALRDRSIGLANACQLGRVLERGLVREGEDWFGKARTTAPSRFRKDVRRRLEEDRQQEGRLVEKALFLGPQAVEDLERARVIASHRAQRELSESQTIGKVLEEWLAERDASRKPDGTRRLPDTALDPYGRKTAEEVIRKILRRSEGRCEVDGCTRTGMHRAHVVARVPFGSPREEQDLVLLCHLHHLLYDAGYLHLLRWTEAGKPVFVDAEGKPFTSAWMGPHFMAGQEAPSGKVLERAGPDVPERLRRAIDAARAAPGDGVVVQPASEMESRKPAPERSSPTARVRPEGGPGDARGPPRGV